MVWCFGIGWLFAGLIYAVYPPQARRDEQVKENKGALPPRTVAEQILWLRQDVPTTPMHVLKLAYLCHGWMLGVFGRGLIAEPAEAWRYGPVIPTVYHTYKSFRGEPIAVPLADRSGRPG